jgi:hypothetical protein
MSTSTYSQHIASLKHKQRRKELLENEKKKTLKKSNSSASSSFSVLSYGTQESGSCIICSKESKDMQDHLLEHNFPPFRENCRKASRTEDLCGFHHRKWGVPLLWFSVHFSRLGKTAYG